MSFMRVDEMLPDAGPLIGASLANGLRKLSLTRSETCLAIALFRGQSVVEYAKQKGISINTARWHVKRIYAKADVNRLNELIHVFLVLFLRDANDIRKSA